MKYRCLPLLFTLACCMARGDTLILKDGQKIEGRYLSSTDSTVQFEVNGKPFTYSTWLIRELRFHPGVNSSPSPATPYNGPRGKEQQDQFCTVLKNYIQARNKVSASRIQSGEPRCIRRIPGALKIRSLAFSARTVSLWTGPGACSFP